MESIYRKQEKQSQDSSISEKPLSYSIKSPPACAWRMRLCCTRGWSGPWPCTSISIGLAVKRGCLAIDPQSNKVDNKAVYPLYLISFAHFPFIIHFEIWKICMFIIKSKLQNCSRNIKVAPDASLVHLCKMLHAGGLPHGDAWSLGQFPFLLPTLF